MDQQTNACMDRLMDQWIDGGRDRPSYRETFLMDTSRNVQYLYVFFHLLSDKLALGIWFGEVTLASVCHCPIEKIAKFLQVHVLMTG